MPAFALGRLNTTKGSKGAKEAKEGKGETEDTAADDANLVSENKEGLPGP